MDADELAVKVVEEINRLPHNDVKQKFRSRCRQNYSDLYYLGAEYVIILNLARAGKKDIVEECVLKQNTPKELIECSKNKYENKEGKITDAEGCSYALYVASLLYYIKDRLKNKDSLGNIILEIKSNDKFLTGILLPLADWLKRLSEAYFESE